MNCERFETLIALYIEGDLTEQRARQLEDHLAACPACLNFAMGLKESHGVLKSLAHEPVEAVVYQRIRVRVLEEIASQQQPRQRIGGLAFLRGWQWKYALVGGLMMLLAAWVLLRPDSPNNPGPKIVGPVKTPGEVTGAKPTPANLVSVNHPDRPGPKGRRRATRRTGHAGSVASQGQGTRRSGFQIEPHNLKFEISRIEPMRIEPMRIDPPPASNQLVVKLVTDDPEGVIIWLIDQKQNGG
jgi:anti-sigma factor RsiW